MKFLTVLFVILIILIQYPLWFSRGGWLNVFDLNNKYQNQKEINQELEKQNDALRAEVNDLKKGTDAIEERARDELEMIKEGEIFFEIINTEK
ncbi:MAG: cell division protein FtsB [Methylophilaceae bacterium]|nr:cell division protein FtsB [Methylophilaceae bacterium]MBL6729154.1 cell division protein FtsB [Methylophilaceae bacterium]MBL6791455.1 cell division protein FtsB [Methylophilaceae bacterium]